MKNNNENNTISIVGFILSFIIPVVGLILSIIGLNKSKELNNKGLLNLAKVKEFTTNLAKEFIVK